MKHSSLIVVAAATLAAACAATCAGAFQQQHQQQQRHAVPRRRSPPPALIAPSRTRHGAPPSANDGGPRIPASSLGMMPPGSFEHAALAADGAQTLLVAATTTDSSPISPPVFDPATSPPLGNGHTTDIIVFIIGLIPFAWATVEFWRRIAVGESFGTGADSIKITNTIGEDGDPQSSRGQRVLGKGALGAAYVLFTVAAASVGLAVYSVVVSPEQMAAGVGGG